MDKGNRDFAAISKVALVHEEDPLKEAHIETQERVAYSRGSANAYKAKPRPRPRQNEGCFICGGRHAWRFFPDKRCPACGQKGHTLKDCSTNRQDGDKRRVMYTGHLRSHGELSAALSVKLNGESVSALVDSGAGPSVIDIETVRDLGLEVELVNKTGKTFGLAKEPVEVIGTLKLTLDLGNRQIPRSSVRSVDGRSEHVYLGTRSIDQVRSYGV